TSTSEAISSPTRCGSSSVPLTAACSSSKRLTRSSVSGSRSANSSSTASVKSGTDSNAARDCASISSYPSFCSSPTQKGYLCGFEQPRCDDAPAPLRLDSAARGEAQLAAALGRQSENLGDSFAQRVCVAGRERQVHPRLLGDPRGDLGKSRVRGYERQ